MSFKTFLLLLIILGLGIFIYLKVESIGSDQSAFNQTTRYQLGAHAIVRTILGLHKDGDARTEYLKGNSSIAIEIAQVVGGGLNQQAIDDFAAKVKQVTGRETHVYYIDGIKEGSLSEQDLAQIAKVDKRDFEPGSPILFVVYANDFDSPTNEIGRTYEEYGMVLSDKRLKDLTANYRESLPQYQESTMLHEFGHQIGLDHNDYPGCLMNAEVESPPQPTFFSGSLTPTDFCQEELDDIQTIKRQVQ